MKKPPRIDEQLCFALYSASRAMTGAYQDFLNTLGLTYPQYLVLLSLWEKDGASVSSIGKHLFLDSATLTPLLKRLEAHGFVERRRSTEDERVVEVFLTPAGKRLERRAGELTESVFCKSGMPLSQITALRDTLHVLTRNLHAAEEQKAG